MGRMMEQGRGGGTALGSCRRASGIPHRLIANTRPQLGGTYSNPGYTDAEITCMDQLPLWLILVLSDSNGLNDG
jgi:hypothetical protein